jgi:hypothetical protein
VGLTYPVIDPVPPYVPLSVKDCPTTRVTLEAVQLNCPAIPVIITPDNVALAVGDVARLDVDVIKYLV